MSRIVLALTAILLSRVSWSQTDTTSGFKLIGFIDAYYAYDANEPVSGDRQYANMVARHNEFNLNHVFLLGSYTGKRMRGEIGIQAGTYPDVNYAAEPSDLYKTIYKAYVGVNLYKNIWLDAGVFEGHFGYETVPSIENEIYSKSLAAEFTPYYQSGLRIKADFDKIDVYLVVLNGWQNIAETNKTKAIGLDIDFFPTDKLEINYGNYFGNEGTKDIGDKYRFHNEGYIKYRWTPKFHTVATFDIGMQEDWLTEDMRNYSFYTAVGQYRFNDKINIAGRWEFASDRDQILISTNLNAGMHGMAYALNINYNVTPNSVLRIEGKYYDMDAPVFNAGEDSIIGSGTSSSSSNTLIALSLAARFE